MLFEAGFVLLGLGGIVLSESYPYGNKDGNCNYFTWFFNFKLLQMAIDETDFKRNDKLRFIEYLIFGVKASITLACCGAVYIGLICLFLSLFI